IPVEVPSLPSVFEQAKLSHHIYHQNVSAVMRMFHLSREQANAVVGSCASCQSFQVPFLSAGINPRGLHSCQLWQTVVT
ncbi:POK19 protein, partial [Aegithalos caudatus]|nr:POK19 protein [Aegithalos caudatus]